MLLFLPFVLHCRVSTIRVHLYESALVVQSERILVEPFVSRPRCDDTQVTYSKSVYSVDSVDSVAKLKRNYIILVLYWWLLCNYMKASKIICSWCQLCLRVQNPNHKLTMGSILEMKDGHRSVHALFLLGLPRRRTPDTYLLIDKTATVSSIARARRKHNADPTPAPLLSPLSDASGTSMSFIYPL